MMASNFNPDPPTGSDSDGRRANTTADTDPHKDMDKEPSDLSDCHPGHDFVPEDEIFYEGETSWLKSKECTKNPGHENFIPVMNFTMDHLPEKHRNERVMTKIKTLIHRTVHIQVNYTSKNRPDTCYDDKRTPYPARDYKGSIKSRTGTGYVMNEWDDELEPKNGDCPCPDCKKSGNPQTRYWKYFVRTAAHVVYDDDEARKTVITCFYDSEEQNEDVVKLYGVGLYSRLSQEEMGKTDLCDWLVGVTHDEQSAQKLDSRIRGEHALYGPACEDIGIIVSHPHGGPKMVSVGNFLGVTIIIKPGDDRRSYTLPKDTTCYVPSDPTGELVPFIIVGPGLKALSFQEKISYLRGATFTVPDDAKYRIRIDLNEDGFTFPPGTTFHSKDGTAIKTRDGTTIPDNAVFLCEDMDTYVTSIDCDEGPGHVSYDIPTCPGSSGAHVTMPEFKGIFLSAHESNRPHSGSGGGYNQGGLFWWSIHFKRMPGCYLSKRQKARAKSGQKAESQGKIRAPGSDSDGRRDNTTADTDPHKDMDKEPSDLSGCRPGNNFVPEDEIFYEGETAESKSKECKKHQGHSFQSGISLRTIFQKIKGQKK